MRVLIATDGSEYSDLVIKTAAERDWPADTHLRVLHVVEPAPNGTAIFFDKTPTLPYPQVVEKQMQAAEQMTAIAAGNLAAAGRVTSNVVREGNPAQEILNEARDWPADLILIGSHGLGKLARLLLGSVVVRVKAQAHCPVEVIRKDGEKRQRAAVR